MLPTANVLCARRYASRSRAARASAARAAAVLAPAVGPAAASTACDGGAYEAARRSSAISVAREVGVVVAGRWAVPPQPATIASAPITNQDLVLKGATRYSRTAGAQRADPRRGVVTRERRECALPALHRDANLGRRSRERCAEPVGASRGRSGVGVGENDRLPAGSWRERRRDRPVERRTAPERGAEPAQVRHEAGAQRSAAVAIRAAADRLERLQHVRS